MTDWAADRRAAAAVHAERLRRRRQKETDAARALIARFLQTAATRAPAPTGLRVTGYGGRGSARTPLTGWYLRADRTAGIDTAGAFYILTAKLSLADRITGYRPAPRDPPLVLGAGGKDGDSIDLADALGRLLAP